ncbi:MAG: PAS domain S-box protein [Spirochaetales bacterium]|nr:PAS domain S-box protein [Spirochaetales bacterium]
MNHNIDNVPTMSENSSPARTIVDETRESFIMVDPHGKVIFINQTGALRLGCTAESMVGTDIFSYFPSDLSEQRRTYLEQVVQNHHPVHFEDMRENKNFWINLYPVSNGSKVVEKVVIFACDITARKDAEIQQREEHKKLEKMVRERTRDLEDLNTALKVLLKKREEDKQEIEDKIFSNCKMLILPMLKKLQETLEEESQKAFVDAIETQLKEIVSPFSKKLSDPLVNLTPTEIRVAGLIKSGKSNKEIADILNSSIHTISRHRENIRKKTGLKNRKTNLRTFLLSL